MICIMHLYKKDKMLFFLFAPFFSVVASLINKLGFYLKFALDKLDNLLSY